MGDMGGGRKTCDKCVQATAKIEAPSNVDRYESLLSITHLKRCTFLTLPFWLTRHSDIPIGHVACCVLCRLLVG